MTYLDFYQKRRLSIEEALQRVRKEKGIELVEGYFHIKDDSHAVRNRERVASFWEIRPENFDGSWYIRQNLKDYLEWYTAKVPFHYPSVSHVVFVFSIGMGMGSALPQPTGQFDLYLNNQKIISFCLVKHSQKWTCRDISFYYQVKRLEVAPPGRTFVLDSLIKEDSMASFGVGLLKVPFEKVQPGLENNLKVISANKYPSNRWFKLDGARGIFFNVNFWDGLEELCKSERNYSKIGSYKVFFGDIHAQSGLGIGGLGTGIGEGDLDENYVYARDVSNLDFFALNEQDYQIGDSRDWDLRKEKVREYYSPGKFVTFLAFEWCSEIYGHRIIYYMNDDQPFFRARKNFDPWHPENDDPNKLWKKLEKLHTEVITVPHHPTSFSHPLCWEYYNPKFERLVEIYSCWGSSELPHDPYRGYGSDKIGKLCVQEALKKGYRLGFIASSDAHDGHPGNAQGTPRHPHLYHYQGSGRAVVLAEELTREAVFQALKERRCYATTGVPIILDFRIDDYLMGSEIPSRKIKDMPRITIEVLGTFDIKKVQIIKNGDVIFTKWGHGIHETVEFKDKNFDPDATSWYYAKVIQKDYEVAWASPIWIFGSTR